MTYFRVVSLVPSVTESLFDLGLGSRLIAATDFCVHPALQVAALPRIGGTKNVRLDEVIALKPDLVIANKEENSRSDVEALLAAGLPVWVTFPHTVAESIELLWDIVRRFDIVAQGHRLAALEKVYEWSAAASDNSTPARTFCPIWRSHNQGEWWMTINGDTYVSDIIRVCGGENIFAGRDRRYPLAADLNPAQAELARTDAEARDTRYPRVTLDEIIAAQPEVILLPSEPYAFNQVDYEYWTQFTDLPAVQSKRVHLVDGSLLTWHGTRLAKALQEIPVLMMPAEDL
jgi:ABC-type Fe3+-hydroxamate transport system substrate-binding protein